jgi:hypothetical protein
VYIQLFLQLPLFTAFEEHPIELYVDCPLKVSKVSAHERSGMTLGRSQLVSSDQQQCFEKN